MVGCDSVLSTGDQCDLSGETKISVKKIRSGNKNLNRIQILRDCPREPVLLGIMRTLQNYLIGRLNSAIQFL